MPADARGKYVVSKRTGKKIYFLGSRLGLTPQGGKAALTLKKSLMIGPALRQLGRKVRAQRSRREEEAAYPEPDAPEGAPREEFAGSPFVNLGARVGPRGEQTLGVTKSVSAGLADGTFVDLLRVTADAAGLWRVQVSIFRPFEDPGTLQAGAFGAELACDREIHQAVLLDIPIGMGRPELNSQTLAFQTIRIFFIVGGGPVITGYRLSASVTPLPGTM